MKEKPILFSGLMVRAILDGRKSMTRRIVKFPEPKEGWHVNNCPYGIPGGRLWVRETWGVQHKYDADSPSEIRPISDAHLHYAATENLGGLLKRPSIHMPRWASRIILEITNVRVERLQEITEEDARQEGIIDGGCLNCGEHEPCGCGDPHPDARDAFIYLWNSINEKRGYGWDVNPLVWVIEFKREWRDDED